jgi:DNA-binding CsgD family transcriptional regulator
VLSLFIERVSNSRGRIFPVGRATYTDREKETLELLVASRSNKEIGSALGIKERTVKSQVAKLMGEGRGTEPHRAFGTCHYAFR